MDETKAQWARAKGWAQVLRQPFMSEQCGAMREVMKRLDGHKVVGGRRLESDRPVVAAEAQAELARARADAEFSRVLDSELQGETDPVRRLLIEATTLHEFGHYKARDQVLDRARAEAEK